MSSNYHLGPLNVCLKGNRKYVELLGGELSSVKVDNDFEPDLEIEIFDGERVRGKSTHFSGKGSMNFDKDTFYVDYDHFYSYEVTHAFDVGVVKVNLFIKKPSFKREAFRLLKSFLSVEYVSREAYIKSLIASYSCLWSIAAICLLKKQYTFIHAGVLAKNNKAIVLSGTGGCGKTSTILHLLSYEKFQYMAEDFGIVSMDGNAESCMKTVSLYHSDVIHKDPSAQSAVDNLSFRKKIRWFFLTNVLKMNPIIKASPDSLTALDIPNEPVPLLCGIHLSRQNVTEFMLKQVTLDEYAARSSNASGRELKSLSEILKLITANAPKEYNYWDDNALMSKLSESYMKAFDGLETFELSIPYKSSPKEVVDFLLEKLDI